MGDGVGVSSRNMRKCADINRILLREEVKAQSRKINIILKTPIPDRTNDDLKVLEDAPELVKAIEKRKKVRSLNEERKLEVIDPDTVLKKKCEQLASVVKNANSLVVYTGAGISTAASIPDYRGPNGVWTLLKQGIQPVVQDLSDAEPTYTHMCLVKLEQLGMVKHVVSQNCDGLHLRSGFPTSSLSEVHGNMYTERCKGCKSPSRYVRLFDVTERTSLRRHGTGRYCGDCDGELRDTIVHFGEKGDLGWPHNWEEAAEAADEADVILCLGSSLKVLKCYPCLWSMHKPHSSRPSLYVVNFQWTPKDDVAQLKINGNCDIVMKLVMESLGIDVPEYKKNLDPIFAMATPLSLEEESTTTKIILQRPTDYEISENQCSHLKVKTTKRRPRKPPGPGCRRPQSPGGASGRKRKRHVADHTYDCNQDQISSDESVTSQTRDPELSKTCARDERRGVKRNAIGGAESRSQRGLKRSRHDEEKSNSDRAKRKQRNICTRNRTNCEGTDKKMSSQVWSGRESVSLTKSTRRTRLKRKKALLSCLMDVRVDVCKLDIDGESVNLQTHAMECTNLKQEITQAELVNTSRSVEKPKLFNGEISDFVKKEPPDVVTEIVSDANEQGCPTSEPSEMVPVSKKNVFTLAADPNESNTFEKDHPILSTTLPELMNGTVTNTVSHHRTSPDSPTSDVSTLKAEEELIKEDKDGVSTAVDTGTYSAPLGDMVMTSSWDVSPEGIRVSDASVTGVHPTCLAASDGQDTRSLAASSLTVDQVPKNTQAGAQSHSDHGNRYAITPVASFSPLQQYANSLCMAVIQYAAVRQCDAAMSPGLPQLSAGRQGQPSLGPVLPPPPMSCPSNPPLVSCPSIVAALHPGLPPTQNVGTASSSLVRSDRVCTVVSSGSGSVSDETSAGLEGGGCASVANQPHLLPPLDSTANSERLERFSMQENPSCQTTQVTPTSSLTKSEHTSQTQPLDSESQEQFTVDRSDPFLQTQGVASHSLSTGSRCPEGYCGKVSPSENLRELENTAETKLEHQHACDGHPCHIGGLTKLVDVSGHLGGCADLLGDQAKRSGDGGNGMDRKIKGPSCESGVDYKTKNLASVGGEMDDTTKGLAGESTEMDNQMEVLAGEAGDQTKRPASEGSKITDQTTNQTSEGKEIDDQTKPGEVQSVQKDEPIQSPTVCSAPGWFGKGLSMKRIRRKKSK